MENGDREIDRPTSVTRRVGSLNPDSVGWARAPLHTTTGLGRGRVKRWQDWGVVSPRLILGLTLADLDHVRVLAIHVLDRETGREIASRALLPRDESLRLTDHCGTGSSRGEGKDMALRFVDDPTGTRLVASAPGVIIDLDVPKAPGRDVVAVLVPWSERRSHHSVKDVGRPVRGSVVVGDVAFAIDDGWTDGTGVTENVLIIDGVLHKIHGDLTRSFDPDDHLRPWRIMGHGVDVAFSPFHERVDRTNLGVIASTTHQCFGTVAGTVRLPAVGVVNVSGLTGWAQDATNRW